MPNAQASYESILHSTAIVFEYLMSAYLLGHSKFIIDNLLRIFYVWVEFLRAKQCWGGSVASNHGNLGALLLL